MYNLKKIKSKYKEAETVTKMEFIIFFKQHLKNGEINVEHLVDKKINKSKMIKYDDINNIKRNGGFYIILSDYKVDENLCEFQINEEGIGKLRAVYRGQTINRNKRLVGHLFRNKYEGKDTKFMKVDGNNGINIDKEPYNHYSWIVIEYSLDKTSQEIKIQMEKAFDQVFGKPIFSSI